MATQADKAELFLALHQGAAPLVMPNPWDVGSAKALAAMGFEALATTSGGFAATLGRIDGSVARDEAVAHAAAVVAAVGVPVSADFENCFAHEPSGVADTIEVGIAAGLAGCSVEDWDGEAIYGRKTTSMAWMTWPTRSPGCSVTKRPGRTYSSPPV